MSPSTTNDSNGSDNGSHAGLGRLQGKVAIVTGASNGIGRAISLLFAREGATVICSDIIPASREGDQLPTHEAITKAGGKSGFVKADVSLESEVANLVQEAVTQHGRLDIMCNNAGIAIESRSAAPVWDYDVADWDLTQNINAKGVFLGCKHASKVMKDQEPGPTGDRGWIVNTASILGLISLPRTLGYCTSKHAVAGITKVAAMDCAPYRIHVNAVCPGFIATDMTKKYRDDLESYERLTALHPFKGFGEPDDIARAYLFLASPENSYMTGTMMPVDGGYTAL